MRHIIHGSLKADFKLNNMPRYKLSRQNLMRAAEGQFYKFISPFTVSEDIVKGSEFILTAEDVLERMEEIPKYFLENYTVRTPPMVKTSNCALFYEPNK